MEGSVKYRSCRKMDRDTINGAKIFASGYQHPMESFHIIIKYYYQNKGLVFYR